MKRKRILLCILCSVLLLFSMAALTAYAHPGRTDSSGGHNDHINGGYHYHHGYSAHDHYDIDGNGIIDCPLEEDQHSPMPFLLVYLFISAFIAPIIIDPFLKSNTIFYQRTLSDSLFFGIFCSVCLFFPLGFIFLPFYRKILSTHAKRKNNVASASSKQASAPLQPITPHTKEFNICHTIWLCTYHISRHCGFSNRAFAQGHIWATLLYITAKHIQNQAIVDQIYSNFESAAFNIADGDPYPPSVLSLIRHGYKQFAPMLNASGIDPKTPEGIQGLWDLIKKEDFKHAVPHPSAVRAYFDYTRILISNVNNYHHSDNQSAPKK